VKTRWNSGFYMLERFLKLANNISHVLMNFPETDAPDMISSTELRNLKDICLLLGPMEVLTKELSVEKSVMSSKIIPLISCTKNELEKQNPELCITKTLKQKLLEELNYRCSLYDKGSILAICTILDPRFKDLHLRDPLINSKTQSIIVNMMESEDDDTTDTRYTSTDTTTNNDEENSSEVKFDLWSLHRNLSNKNNDKKMVNTTSRNELRAYLNKPLINIQDDPLKHWEEIKISFPRLYKLAMKYLLIPATSVPTERLFSKAGATVTKSRNRLSGETLSKLLFLQSLNNKYWHF